jgi:membrane-bound metal-dependent hydrolase YbcI (DUF457 family)
MPSPIAHTAAGYAIYRVLEHRLPRVWLLPRGHRALAVLGVLFFALMPDLDAVPGVLFGNLHRYHNQFTHSLLVGAAVGLAAAAGARLLRVPTPWWWFSVAFLGYELHVGLDYFTTGRGVMALWPLTDARFQPPAYAFFGLGWALSFTNPQHLWTVANETAFAVLVLAMARLAAHRLAQRPE